MRLLLITGLFGLAALAQEIPQAPAAPVPPNTWAGVGALHSGSSTEGYVTYAKLCTLKPCSAAQGLYSYSGYNVMRVNGKPTAVADTGGALLLRTWKLGGLGTVFVLGFGTVGLATGATASLTGSGGGIGVFRIGKTSYTIQGSYRRQVVNGASIPVYGFGIGKVL